MTEQEMAGRMAALEKRQARFLAGGLLAILVLCGVAGLQARALHALQNR